MGETLNVLVIPLLGGFVFVIFSKIFRHRIIRHDGQYLFFLSATFGFLFLTISYFVTQFISYLCPVLVNAWSTLMPFSYSGTAYGSFIIGVLSSIPFILMPRDAVLDYIINQENDAIETMLWKAMNRALMVCVTLDNDKVYVGFVSNMFYSDFRSTKSIGIIPSLSGYRDDSDKNISFENYYEDIIEDVDQNPEKYTVDENYISVSIPISRVVSISYFDPAIHRFNEQESREQAELFE